MASETTIRVSKHSSTRVELGSLIISVAALTYGETELVVGRPGFPNVSRTLKAGGAILFETPDHGLLEVRVMVIQSISDRLELLVSKVSSSPGFGGAFDDGGLPNAPFDPGERARIATALDEVRNAIATHPDLTPEQVDYLSRKLDDLKTASERFGRRDWINLVVGTITNAVVSAALGSEVGKFIFKTLGDALMWLLGVRLLQ